MDIISSLLVVARTAPASEYRVQLGGVKRPCVQTVRIARDQEAKSTGGIIIPDTAQEKPMEGEVIAVGPGARGEDGKVHPLEVKTGDRVLFGKWSGTEIKIDGEELMIMKEADIMGHFEGGAASAKTR